MAFGFAQDFPTPKNMDASIWRYMNLAAFLKMLMDRQLFMPSIRYLSEQDPYEGLNVENKARTFVSCWYLSQHESDAMWKLYAVQGQGVAVRSTIARLAEAIESEERTVYIGEVQYLDLANNEAAAKNLYSPSLHKRLSFKHECELRAVIDATHEYPSEHEAPRSGIGITVSLQCLIDAVLVGPVSPPWHVKLIEDLLPRFDLSSELVVRSSHNDAIDRRRRDTRKPLHDEADIPF